MSTLVDAYDDSHQRHNIPVDHGRGAGGGAPKSTSPLPTPLDYVVTLLPAEVLTFHTTWGTDLFEKLGVKGAEDHFYLFGLAAAIFYLVGRIGTKGYKSLLNAMGKAGGDLEKERKGFLFESIRIVIPAIAMGSWLLFGETDEAKAAFNDERLFLYGVIALGVAAGLKWVSDKYGWKAQ